MTDSVTSWWLFIVPLTLLFLGIFTLDMNSCFFLKDSLRSAIICDENHQENGILLLTWKSNSSCKLCQ